MITDLDELQICLFTFFLIISNIFPFKMPKKFKFLQKKSWNGLYTRGVSWLSIICDDAVV